MAERTLTTHDVRATVSDLTGAAWAYIDKALGHDQVFVREAGGAKRQLTFAQGGDFSVAVLSGKRTVEADAPYDADDGPETVYADASLTYRERMTAAATAILWILIVLGQSNAAGATNNSGAATASITAQNTFTKTFRVSGSGAARAFTLAIAGTWAATVVLQRSDVRTDAGTTGPWSDVATKSWTANTSQSYNDGLDDEIVWYRIGVKTGGFTSGTVVASLTPSITPETGPLTTTPPLPGKAKVWNGGDTPLQTGVASSAVDDEIRASQFSRPVDACSGLNPSVQRETMLMGALEVFAAHIAENDEALGFNCAIGGEDFSDLVDAAGTLQQPMLNIQKLVRAAVAYADSRGMSARVASFDYNGNEASSNAAATANWITSLETLRERVDELQAITGQAETINIILPLVGAPRDDINHDPDANRDTPTPDTSSMGLVSNVTLGSEEYCREDDEYAGCFAQYDQNSDENVGGVHYNDSLQHRFMGEKAGWLALDMVTGLHSRLHPYIVEASRVIPGKTLRLELSEAATLDETLVRDPGAYGFSYADGDDAVPFRDPPNPVFDHTAKVLELTLAAEPSGDDDEELLYACGNAVTFAETVADTVPDGSGKYAHTAPTYGLGPQVGQRGNLRARDQRWYSQMTGRPLHRYFAHQQLAVKTYMDRRELREALDDLDVGVWDLILDFGDSRCYPSGQTLADLSDYGRDFYLGTTSGSEARDPTFTGTAGALDDSAYLSFDGGDECMPQTTPLSLMDAWHTPTASLTVGAVYWCPSTVSAIQHILCNTRNFSSAVLGAHFRLNSAGRPNLVVSSATGNSTLINENLGSTVALGQWAFAAFGISAAGQTGWGISTALNGSTTFAVDLALGSTGAPDGSAAIGRNGTTVIDANALRLMSGFRLAWLFAANTYYTAAQMMPLWRTAQRRFPGA